MDSADSEPKRLFADYDNHQDKILADYFELLRFKSISSEAEFKPELLKCGEWVVKYLKDCGLNVTVWEGNGPPVIFAEHCQAGADKHTVLVYNHYDVQPVDPLELWESPPFEPTVRGNEVFARGAQDNKGQLAYVLAAVRRMLERDGKLPINLKLCIEGQEECGSTFISEVIKKHREELRADSLLVVDSGFIFPNAPRVTLGARGMSQLTVEITGSKFDLHSGNHGGMTYNPARAACEIAAALRDSNGRVTVPGFYDDVLEPTKAEISRLSFDFDEDWYRQTFAAEPVTGEKGFTPMQANWLRPALEINGIGSGYFGDGSKTIIPARAVIKLSARLVPNQDPIKIGQQIKDYILKLTPHGVQTVITPESGGGKGFRGDPDSKGVVATCEAYRQVLGVDCKLALGGASYPITAELVEVSGATPVVLGYGLPDDQIHAPNEHFGLDRMRKGFVTFSRILQLLGS